MLNMIYLLVFFILFYRHWAQLRKLRTKLKKNLDTKASKDRKIRYNVHKKLVNYMAPIDRCSFTDEAK